MQLGNTTIHTPADNPVQYDPAWRSVLAASWADFPSERWDLDYLEYKKDPWVQAQYNYLRAVRDGKRLTKEQKALKLASTWYQGNRATDVKFKLEPLLLTPASFEIITMDIGGGSVDQDVFRAYERLYFNARMDNGEMHKSCHLRTFFAMPDGNVNEDTPNEMMWRVVASSLGYGAVVSMWLWSGAHGLRNLSQDFLILETWRAAQALLIRRMASQQISNFDLTQILKVYVEHERMRKETASSDTLGTQSIGALAGVLAMTAPVILNAAKEVDKLPELTAAVQARIAAQRNINMTGVIDAGVDRGKDGLDQMIDAEFKDRKQLTE